MTARKPIPDVNLTVRLPADVVAWLDEEAKRRSAAFGLTVSRNAVVKAELEHASKDSTRTVRAGRVGWTEGT